MKAKQTGRLHFFWILIVTGLFTLWASLKIILLSIVAKQKRSSVNKVFHQWSQRLLNLVRVEYVVEGAEKMPQDCKRPIIVMCNHSSLYDIPVSALVLKDHSLRMLAKKELFRIPVFATAMRNGEFVSIDRQNKEQAIQDLISAKEKMLSGIVLWIAPEGTRSKDAKLAKFKRGGFHLALETQALIVPMVIKDIYKVQAGRDLTLRLGQQVSVEICDPVDAADYTLEQRADLVDKVRSQMLLTLGQEEAN